MKLIHTADWHLGKIVSGFSMLGDQAYYLRGLCALLETERPDALLICGDVYDRPIPSADAVRLLNDTLSDIVLRLSIPVFLIAGNHDSGDRLGFASRFLEKSGLYISGAPQAEPVSVTLTDKYGPVCFYLLPYLDPPTIRTIYPDEKVSGWQQAFDRAAVPILSAADAGTRNVLLCHGFFCCTKETNAAAAEAELGGADLVNLNAFTEFSYVAAGHVHRPGTISQRMRYSGSMLKYSIREAAHHPSITVVTLGETPQDVIMETRTLPVLHDLRILSGNFAELMTQPSSDDYLFIQLADRELILNAAARLRERYPNLMGVSYQVLEQEKQEAVRTAAPQKSLSEQFADFYQLLTDDVLSEQQRTLIEETEQELKKEAL